MTKRGWFHGGLPFGRIASIICHIFGHDWRISPENIIGVISEEWSHCCRCRRTSLNGSWFSSKDCKSQDIQLSKRVVALIKTFQGGSDVAKIQLYSPEVWAYYLSEWQKDGIGCQI